jgi:hypothetical protein
MRSERSGAVGVPVGAQLPLCRPACACPCEAHARPAPLTDLRRTPERFGSLLLLTPPRGASDARSTVVGSWRACGPRAARFGFFSRTTARICKPQRRPRQRRLRRQGPRPGRSSATARRSTAPAPSARAAPAPAGPRTMKKRMRARGQRACRPVARPPLRSGWQRRGRTAPAAVRRGAHPPRQRRQLDRRPTRYTAW